MIVYSSIGNSDDMLTQQEWSMFQGEFRGTVARFSVSTHGVWYSRPDDPYQNMCICFDMPMDLLDQAEEALVGLRKKYRQDSITFASALPKFL